MSLLMIEAKRALFDRLAVVTYPVVAGEPVTVSYAGITGEPTKRMVYGRSARFVRDQDVAEWAVLVRDDVTVDFMIAVYEDGDDGRHAEQDAENIAEAIEADLKANPKLAGSLTWVQFTGGDITYQVTPNPEPGITAFLALSCNFLGRST